MEKYKLHEKVGDGTYGNVFKATELSTNETVAIKALKSKINSWKECLQLCEVKALSKLNNNSSIIKLKEVIRENNSNVFLVFEYMEMNLYNLIEKIKAKSKRLSENAVKIIVEQVLTGLNYMHSNNYIHRDLKPENILINYNEGKEESIQVKIADFGLAREYSPTSSGVIPLTDYVCTRWYRAPECVLKSNHYNHSVDIFALGAIFCELFSLKPLFPGTNETDQMGKIIKILGTPDINDWPEGYKLINKLNMKFPSFKGLGIREAVPGLSDQAYYILIKMLEYNPNKRISSKDLLQESYFSRIKSHYKKDSKTNSPPDFFNFPPTTKNNNNTNSNNNNNNSLLGYPPSMSYEEYLFLKDNGSSNIAGNISSSLSKNKQHNNNIHGIKYNSNPITGIDYPTLNYNNNLSNNLPEIYNKYGQGNLEKRSKLPYSNLSNLSNIANYSNLTKIEQNRQNYHPSYGNDQYNTININPGYTSTNNNSNYNYNSGIQNNHNYNSNNSFAPDILNDLITNTGNYHQPNLNYKGKFYQNNFNYNGFNNNAPYIFN